MPVAVMIHKYGYADLALLGKESNGDSESSFFMHKGQIIL